MEIEAAIRSNRMSQLGSRLDACFDRWSERFNPIVVKDMRQAIRSRAFSAAFMTMLVVCQFNSLLLVSALGERIELLESGREFLPFYLVPLLFAVCFVVPLGLFHNVVAEFDGQTFEVLAITSLSPSRIVFGKLQSAVVQMGTFFAAAAPFLCFSFLLEGLSAPGILLALAGAFCSGLAACLGAIMFGTLGKQSAWQVLCLPATVVLGGVMFGIGLGTGLAAATERGAFHDVATAAGGLCCFGYAFFFFVILTLGVSIAQFTATLPRAGQVVLLPPRPPQLSPLPASLAERTKNR